MTAKGIAQAMEHFLEKELPALQKLEDYYVGKHKILDKKDRIGGKKDAKLVHNYPELITTLATAYFLGEPVAYTFDDTKSNDFEKLNEYLATEEEQQENFEHAENCSVFGKSYELWYVGPDLRLGNIVVDPRDMFVIRDNTVNKNIIAAVRWDYSVNEKNETEYILEVYDTTRVTKYSYFGNKKEAVVINGTPKLHGFNQVPVVEFINNKRRRGDFEGVLTLIDAYNEINSTSVDDMKDFTDAYLVLKNLGGTTDEDIDQVKRDRVIKVDGDGDAYWLTKQVNDTYAQNNKNRINQDIHKFSLIPDMQDKEFSGNSSGVALGYKLLALEQLTAKKEMYFKRALNQRMQIMIDFYNLHLDPEQIQKVFTRNTPKNLVEIADVVTKLSGVVSKETLLSNIPFVESATTELEKLKAEESTEMQDMNTPLKADDGHGEDE